MSAAISQVGGDPRPVISVSTDLADVVDEALYALSKHPGVYQRDGYLVHVVGTTEEEAKASVMSVGTPQIRPLTSPTVREWLTRVARFRKKDGRGKDPSKTTWVWCIPTDHVVHATIARGNYPAVRHISGVIEAPSIRPDGSIIQDPGYDPQTGYLFIPNDTFDRVPESPTQEEARASYELLEEVFWDFPYAKPEHRATDIAALLTIIGRPAIAGNVPAFLSDAATRGSGKTLKTDAIALAATGRTTSKMSYPVDDVELEKVLSAYALRGAMIVNFDNVTRTFGGGPLDRCLTAVDSVELRVLGKSEVPALRWLAVIMATGNNIALSGDTARRALFSRLESKLENPEERQETEFRHPKLLQWVKENRQRLVAAALTVLRAWFVAGKPTGNCRTWGSFEAWAGIIPPAIVFAGGADPMLTRPAATGEEDGEKQALMAILDGLARLCPTREGMTAKGMIDALYPHRDPRDGPADPDGFDDLREALETLCSAPPGRAPKADRVGNSLRKFRRRVVDGRMLDSRSAKGGAKRWWVSKPGESGEAQQTLMPKSATIVPGDPGEAKTGSVSDDHRNTSETKGEAGDPGEAVFNPTCGGSEELTQGKKESASPASPPSPIQEVDEDDFSDWYNRQ